MSNIRIRDISQAGNRSIMIFGLIGIIGAMITMASDLVLLAQNVSGLDFFRSGIEKMGMMPKWRITTGVLAGVIALPFQSAGMIMVYHMLKPSGRKKALAVSLLLLHSIFMGIAFHVSYAFLAEGYRAYNDSAGSEIIRKMLAEFKNYWNIISLIILSEVIIASVIFIHCALKQKKIPQVLYIAGSPVSVLGIVFLITLLLKVPLGGIIGPVSVNLSTAVFFGLCMIYVCKIHEKDKKTLPEQFPEALYNSEK